jgi:hypothetical protein
MPMDVTVNAATRVVRVAPAPLIDLDVAREMLREAAIASHGMDGSRVVLDLRRARSRLDLGSLWHLAASLAEHAEAFRRRTALVTTPELLQQGHFFALSAQNRGFEVRAFDEYDAALEWLMQDDTPARGGRLDG